MGSELARRGTDPLEILVFAHRINKFSTFHRTRRFIAALSRHCSLFWVTWIQFTLLHPVPLRSIMLLTADLSYTYVPRRLFLSFISTRTLYVFLFCPLRTTVHALRNLLDLSCLIILFRIQIMKLHVIRFSCHSLFPMAPRPNAGYGLIILEISTTVGRTPWEEWSARRRDP